MKIRIELLGRFTVHIDDREIAAADWRRGRAAALLKFLALTPHHRVHREQVIEEFWPDLDLEPASANCRKAIHYARKVLGRPDVIEVGREIISLSATADLEIDAEQFARAAKAALRSGDAGACAEAAALYGGDLLPDDRYVPWLEPHRASLRQLYVHVLRVARLWHDLIALDPTDEEAQCALMQMALDAGNRNEAIRLFNQLRERLHIELGLGPNAATMAIYQKALALPGLEPVSATDRLRATLARGLVHMQSGEFGKADEIARAVRAQAFSAGLGREAGEASALLAMAAKMQGRWQAVFHDEIIASVRRYPEMLPSVFEGHLCLAEFCLCSADGPAQAAGLGRTLLQVSAQSHSAAGRGLACLILGEVALMEGERDVASSLLTEATALLLETEMMAGHVLALERLAEIAVQRGQRAQARRLVRRGFAGARTSWLQPHLDIRMKAIELRCEPVSQKALKIIRDGDLMLTPDACQPCSMAFRTTSAIVLAEIGHVEELDRRLGDAERIAGLWHGGPWAAALLVARGVQRRAQKNTVRAAAAFAEAAARYEELGRPIDQRRCLARLEAVSRGAE